MYRAVQAVLADYQVQYALLSARFEVWLRLTCCLLQQIAEDRIFTIATSLRKHVIFSASALANEQVVNLLSGSFRLVLGRLIFRCFSTTGR
jgi:hypothetical protein